MFKSEYSNNFELFNTYSIIHSHAFWNEIIFVCITDKYMEFDLNDKGDIGKIPLALKPSNIFSYSLQLLLSVTHTIFTYCRYKEVFLLSVNNQLCRFDGVKTNAGKTRTGQDSLRAEKDDVRGCWRDIEGNHLLPRLPEYDAGKKKCNP